MLVGIYHGVRLLVCILAIIHFAFLIQNTKVGRKASIVIATTECILIFLEIILEIILKQTILWDLMFIIFYISFIIFSVRSLRRIKKNETETGVIVLEAEYVDGKP